MLVLDAQGSSNVDDIEWGVVGVEGEDVDSLASLLTAARGQRFVTIPAEALGTPPTRRTFSAVGTLAGPMTGQMRTITYGFHEVSVQEADTTTVVVLGPSEREVSPSWDVVVTAVVQVRQLL